MKKRICLMIAVAILISICPDGPVGAADRISSSYEVMSLLIREEFGSDFGLILIESETEPLSAGISYVFSSRDWTELKKETIDSLITLNSGPAGRLEAKFDLPVEYRLVSEEEYLEALAGGAGPAGGDRCCEDGYIVSGKSGGSAPCDTIRPDWDGFDRIYPDAQGLITFSRVAFDPERTQALLIFSNAYRCSGDRVRAQGRKTAFFVFRDGAWELAGVTR